MKALLYVVCLLFILLLPITKTSDFDIFFHIRLGELIFFEKALPENDTLSYTSNEQRLYHGDWLSNLILYLIYKGGGYIGLMVFKMVVFLLTLFFLYKTCLLFEDREYSQNNQRHNGGYVRGIKSPLHSKGLIAITLLITALSMRFRLNLRPYYFSFLFLSIFLYLFSREQKAHLPPLLKGGKGGLLFLPFIQLIWANTHGSSFIGPVLSFLFFVTESIRKKGINKRLLIILLLIILFGGISPEGFKSYGMLYSFMPFTSEKSGFSISDIDEWTPATPEMLWGYGLRYTLPFQIIVIGSFIFIIISLIKEGLRKRQSSEIALQSSEIALQSSEIALLFHIALFIACIFYSLKYIRLIDLSSIALAPLFYGFLRNTSNFLRVIGNLPTPLRKWGFKIPLFFKEGLGEITKLRIIATFLLSIFIALFGYTTIFKSPIYTFGIGLKERVFPLRQVEFLKSHNIKGNGFNTIPAGSYMLFMDKERKVFIDGRLSYKGELITTYFESLKSPETFKTLDNTYNFQYAIAEYGSIPSWKFPFHLNENPQWALVSWDIGGALYLKKTTNNETLIKRYAYLIVKPNFYRFDYLNRSLINGTALLTDIDHDISLNPENQETYLAKAYAGYYLGKKDIAFKELKTALTLKPDIALEHIAMAQLLIERKDIKEAKKELKKALRLEPYNKTAKHLLSFIDKLEEL